METAPPAAAGIPRLELEDLTVGFRKKPILTGVSLGIKAGELLVLAGPNGSGKTTLLKTIGGILNPLAGRVLLDGRDTASMGKREKAGQISLLFQGTSPGWPFTVQEIIAQGRFPYRGIFGAEHPRDQKAVARAIKAAGLLGFEDRPVTELSGGEFQRVLIARAMAQEAKLLLLDEPANTLDPKYRFMVMTLLRSITGTGAGALVSLHDLNLARLYADRIILIGEGKIFAQGKPSEVLREETIGKVFDLPPGLGAI
ncbi:MAG: ABC transporter ATP-binding protein [Spirochaetaceae bacterium]|jgi:iron complex transport system ATP-binding protein|nr:ABC transporter ATP-binding protein [Spirochaetaceae bacterium]